MRTAWSPGPHGPVNLRTRQQADSAGPEHRLWPVRANRGTILSGRSFGETAHNKLNNVVED